MPSGRAEKAQALLNKKAVALDSHLIRAEPRQECYGAKVAQGGAEQAAGGATGSWRSSSKGAVLGDAT